MVGFGHASQAFMEHLQAAIVSAVVEAAAAAKPSRVRHVRTPSLSLSINRRQRTEAAGGEPGRTTGEAKGAPAKTKGTPAVLWFERAGATQLGQRAQGPRVPHADAVQFVHEHGEETIATLLSFACHPVCYGKVGYISPLGTRAVCHPAGAVGPCHGHAASRCVCSVIRISPPCYG